MIHLHRLRLTGPRQTYGVNFDQAASNLAIIAGPIHTGKTTVLEMVDYLFGDDEHPDHPELAATVRSAEIEFSVDGRRWTIERPLFSPEQAAWLREGGLDDAGLAERKVIDPVTAENSLSAWVLNTIGLHGTRLRVTEDNPNSPAHSLSIRDVMWVTYLPSSRMDNNQLLHEGHDQKHYKLRQVIELLFDVHDDRLAQLLRDQKALVDERREAQREVAALEAFLAEEEVLARPVARERLASLTSERERIEQEVALITQRGTTRTRYAEHLRLEYGAARRRTGRAAARLRDREALLDRLLPLRAQYAEDERKLVFQLEAGRIFDPLQVKRCPGCLEELPEGVRIEENRCTLCHRELKPSESVVFEFNRERRALQQRIRDLDAYSRRVEDQVEDARSSLAESESDEARLAAELDDRTRIDLNPFIGEREALLRRHVEIGAEQANLKRSIRWQDALVRRQNEVVHIEERLKAVRSALADLRVNQPDRRGVVAELSERFATLLRDWGFPKLDDGGDPHLNEHFVPIVRGRPYRSIGSDGAKTLIAVAWMLAIFEMAVERGAPHPGFVMIDGPQKNLAPRAGAARDEFTDPAIAERMYKHTLSWAAKHQQAQIILVDHEAPKLAQDHEIVRYTRRADVPPYGLIEDQVETRPNAT